MLTVSGRSLSTSTRSRSGLNLRNVAWKINTLSIFIAPKQTNITIYSQMSLQSNHVVCEHARKYIQIPEFSIPRGGFISLHAANLSLT